MASDVPVPRSYQGIMGDLLGTFSARSGIQTLKVGGSILTALEAAAQSDLRNTQDVFNVLDLEDFSRLRGSALDFKAQSEGLERLSATPSSGSIDILDTGFSKISSKIYSGIVPPTAGSIIVFVADYDSFPSSGSVYIGRGTVNNEGPLAYTKSVISGRLDLVTPTQKSHNVNEEVVVAQGGNRPISIGAATNTTQNGRVSSISFQTTASAVVLDGETVARNVSVVCQQPGTTGNIPAGGITGFSSVPFPGATATNPSSFNNGADAESDDGLVDRLRKTKASKSRGTETSILLGASGAVSADENKRILSTSLVRPAGEPAILYIDDGTGYEEQNTGIASDILVDSASGGEQYFSLSATTPISKAFIKSGAISPFTLRSGCVLSVKIGGVLNEHTFNASDFTLISSATSQEVVSSINSNPNISFSARTSDGGTRIAIFARAEIGEDIQVVEQLGVVDANGFLVFSTTPTYTLKLYKSDILLYKDGKQAIVIGAPQTSWGSMSDGITLKISVDNTPTVIYTFTGADFTAAETGYSSVSQTNSIDSWVAVLNSKIPGVTATNGGGFIELVSNRGRLSTASVVLQSNGGADLVSAGMFNVTLGLSSYGLNKDYTLDRMTGQIKLTIPLAVGDSLTVGSTLTRGYVQSGIHTSGSIVLSTTARIWIAVDSAAERVAIQTSASTYYSANQFDDNKMTYAVFPSGGLPGSVVRGDIAIAWDPALTSHGVFRVAKTGAGLVRLERPSSDDMNQPMPFTLSSDGLQFFRLTNGTVQEIRLAVGTRTLQSLADEINSQVVNAVASVYRGAYLRLTTNGFEGDITVLTADASGQALLFPLAKTKDSVLSHVGFIRSRQEVGTPWFSSLSYVKDVAGDLAASGVDTQHAFTATNTNDISDPGQLGYFCRKAQSSTSSIDNFGTSADKHYPILSSSYGSVSRFLLRKFTPATSLPAGSIQRTGIVVTATFSDHKFVVGDLVWIQYQSTPSSPTVFDPKVVIVTATTSTTFSYVDPGSNGLNSTLYSVNLWDGTLSDITAMSGDGFVLVSPFSVTPRDTLNVVMNGDSINQSYSILMRRRVKPVSDVYGTNSISVVDADNSDQDLGVLFGTSDPDYFADFWAFMRARTVSHGNDVTKTVLWRTQRFGPEGNAFRVSYDNPRIQDTSIGYGTKFNSDGTLMAAIYLPHGAVRSSLNLFPETMFIRGVSTVGNHDEITYTYSSPSVSLTKSGTIVTATTVNNHGYSIGDTIYISATSDGVNYPIGAKIVTNTPLTTTFQYTEVSGGTTATATASSVQTSPTLSTGVSAGDIAIIANDGTGSVAPVGSWSVATVSATQFKIRVPTGSVPASLIPKKLGAITNLQFAPITSTSVADIVSYVNSTSGIMDLISGWVPVGGGAGLISTGTQDEYFSSTINTGLSSSVKKWSFTDGLNYVLSSDLSAGSIILKNHPATNELHSIDFVNEEIQLVPVTATSVSKWLKTPAVNGSFTAAEFSDTGELHSVQAAALIQGTTGGIQIAGGLANSTQAALIGTGENSLGYGRVLISSDSVAGLGGKQWVALTNTLATQKSLSITGSDTVTLAADGTITFSSPVWTKGTGPVVSVGKPITIQKVGNFVAYIFSSAAVIPTQCAVGAWVNYIGNGNSSNSGKFRICGVVKTPAGTPFYTAIWVENPNGVSEVVLAAGEDLKIYTADSVMPGDTISFNWPVGGYSANQGSFTVLDSTLTGSNTVVKVQHAFAPVTTVAIGSNLSSIRVTESSFRLIERIDFLAPNPLDSSQSFVALYPQTSSSLLSRLNPNSGAVLTVLDKMGFPTEPAIGADGYAISTGLIGEVAKILYGDTNSPSIYPGLVAVGATVFVSGPNTKRIKVSLQIRIRTGVPQSTLIDRVRSSVASEINKVPLGTPVDISRIVAAARRVQGIVSVVVLSPVYGVGNDQIAVSANEKPFVYSPVDDISVTIVT
jgi:hypothetical protein